MGFMQRIFGRTETRAMPDLYPSTHLGFFGSGPTDTGITVTPENALTASCVWACISIIADAMSALPCHVLNRADGTKQTTHNAYRIMHDEPNVYMSSASFRQAMMLNLLTYGNAYAFIDKDDLGNAIGLYPLLSNRTRAARINGELFYQTEIGTSARTLPPDRVFHVMGMTWDGINGLSPIQYARQNIGLSHALESFAARFFGNGATLGGIIEAPNLSPEAAKNFMATWKASYTGLANSFKTALLPGMKYHQLGTDPERAQMVATRVNQLRECARIFRVPLHMLGDLEKASYASVEQQSLDFVQNTVQPHVIRWESEANRKLFLQRARPLLELRFNLDSLLRADTAARYAAHATGINAGFITVNEARAKENLPAVEGGDVLRAPLNTAPIGTPPTPQRALPDPAAARELVIATANRVLTKEARAIQRAAKKFEGKPQELRAWAEAFYRDHEPLVAQTFAPALKTIGGSITDADYARQHCQISLAAVIDAIDGKATEAELIEQLEQERPQTIADQLIH